MHRITQLFVVSLALFFAFSITACGSGGTGGGGGQNLSTPTVTVTPAVSSITTAQSLSVTVRVTGSGGTPTGSVVLSGGGYTASSTTLSAGAATFSIAAGALTVGADTLTAQYSPDAASASAYNSASGSGSVMVSAVTVLATPTVTVTPSPSSISTAQSVAVTVAVTGAGSTPTGSIVLSGGGYTSSSTTLSAGSSSFTIAAGALATGADTLTAQYSPDASSASAYNSASGSGLVTVYSSSNTTAVSVNVNVLANRHAISPYIYGGSYPASAAAVTDSGLSIVRWGGNAASTYNWKLHTNNADNDYYWEDFNSNGFNNGNDADSVQFVTDVKSAGSHALMTMPMLDWVAQSAENGSNGHWSFPVSTYGAQCAVDPYNTDAGDGDDPGANCSTDPVPVTTAAVTTAYYPLVDTAAQCPTGTTDGSTCLDRQTWAQALATAMGTDTCAIPYYANLTSCHFYDMDNEVDIWGGTHRDVHPAPSGYDELVTDYETEATNLKTWDPSAERLGPVSCCWWYYWNGANSSDKAAHGGVDFLPYWLNQVYWEDQIAGHRTLDIFDIHAYPDGPDTSTYTTAQKQALAAEIYRDYWDPTFVSPSGVINQIYATSIEPNRTIPFRIPRMKALVNAIYPGTPLAFTEWSAAFDSESDFSTALGDADAYGILGREGLALASRWEAPLPANPNYQALKLYTNYDGSHDSFGTVSVSDTNTGNVNLFSSYAALNAAGTTMTLMVINKDPSNTALATFDLSGFNATSYVAYTLSSSSPTAIAASSSQTWTGTQAFAPYSVTLLVISGSQAAKPVSEWYLNPGDIMVPASGSVTIHPAILSGSTNVALTSAVFDAYEGAPACTGSLAIGNSTVTPTATGAITLTAGSTPGFCHYTVTGSDGAATETEGGWLVVGNPPATLTQTGNNQTGTEGAALADPLTVTLAPGSSGGAATGAKILFTTSAGTLSNGTTTGTSVIATTNSSGVASVTLTLPASAQTVTVKAQDQFSLGGASVNFTETAP